MEKQIDESKYNEIQLALITHIKMGRKAIKEAERLYKLLNEISLICNKYKDDLTVIDIFTKLERVYGKKDDGEIVSNGKYIYWKKE
jgi:hypothetical protein